MDAMDALATIVTSPEKFLKQNIISIAGGSKNGQTKARFLKRKNNEFKFDAAGMSGKEGVEVNVWNFRMVRDSEAVNLEAVDHLHVQNQRPQICITGKLSGCTVLLSPEGNNSIRAAHIQPGGVRPGGNDTQAILEGQALMGGAPVETAFGPEEYTPERAHTAHVIGFARPNGWEFWAQTCHGCAGSQRIVEVRQLT
ncbi:MAG: hypothetical protein AAGD13_06550 [Pseudomonadota bacterium]